MFGKKKFKVTSSKVDPAGKKTTITISTDDEKVVRKLLDSSKMESMDAEFKETKKASGTNKKNSKTATKPTKKTTLKALPSPKASQLLAKQPQKKEAKPKAKKDSSSLKAYIYKVPELNMIGRGELAVFAPDKKNADRLMEQYCKKTGFHCNFNRTSLTKFHSECIKKHGLNANNYYQKQLESILSGGKKYA